MLLGQCNLLLNATDMTIEDNTWGEVFRLAWHPFRGEIFGLTLVGLLFRWDPYDEEANATVDTGADCLTVSWDGSLVATGDAVGTIKIYATADFSLLYQLASQDPITHLSFSTDSRRLYDIRGAYGNVWEPSTLVRLADCSDHGSESYSETESIAKASLYPEHHLARVDSVIALAEPVSRAAILLRDRGRCRCLVRSRPWEGLRIGKTSQLHAYRADGVER